MILSSANFGDARILLLPLLWGLVIYSLVSGYSIRIMPMGSRIISRKIEPIYFWILWSFHFIFVDIISYLILVP